MEHLKHYCISGGIRLTEEKARWLEQNLRIALEQYTPEGEISVTEVEE